MSGPTQAQLAEWEEDGRKTATCEGCGHTYAVPEWDTTQCPGCEAEEGYRAQARGEAAWNASPEGRASWEELAEGLDERGQP